METKSLKEQVEEVMNSKMSYTAKKQTLLKIRGLRPGDVNLIISVAKMNEGKKFDASGLTFGVELETVGAHYTSIQTVLREKGLQVYYAGYSHHDEQSAYKLVTDSSLHDPSGNGEIECVTPILKGAAGRASLKACCEGLDAAGATVNRSCGTHVHIGARDLSDEHYIRIFKNYQKCEQAIDSFLAPSRRGDAEWCGTLEGHDFSGCRTKDDVYRVLGGRYFKVNPAAYHAHGTIEFRQHHGTTNYTKIIKWVEFLFALIAWSFDNELDHEVTVIAGLPFLTDSQKRWFENRAAEIARNGRAA